jgi:hypothetical protein
MKIRATITAVEEIGGDIVVEARGFEDSDPAGTLARGMRFALAQRKGRGEAFHVGREITIEINPRSRR